MGAIAILNLLLNREVVENASGLAGQIIDCLSNILGVSDSGSIKRDGRYEWGDIHREGEELGHNPLNTL
jgi:hypothetical protein